MKKNLKVIQINGFRGLFLTLFILSCLIAGFIAFPSFLAMYGWNLLAIKTGSFPVINFGQGLLLWAIVAMTAFISSKRKFIVSFNSSQELSDDELKTVMSKIKQQNIQMNNLNKSNNENIINHEITEIHDINDESKKVHSNNEH